MSKEDLKEFLEKYYDGCELSSALVDRIVEMLDTLIDEEVVVCPHCGKLFLESENALQYEQADGDYTCDCLSPENQAADWADDWVKEQKIGD